MAGSTCIDGGEGMMQQRPLIWYAWAALFGVVAALCAILFAMFWIRIGVDPWLASNGVPPWVGHGLLTVLVVFALARGVKRVMAP
jgi:hypothetical protein